MAVTWGYTDNLVGLRQVVEFYHQNVQLWLALNRAK